ncbi:MAG: type II toxin-antitoxin system prevent-host-death family antitoxin [SAR324 cluster bacterium]|nr:type II toxin-antitoxin system prevent-host-death family antitoxin [SAR324 cluster bacterium]
MKTVSEVKVEFNALVASPESTLISKNGKPIAALVPYAKYQEMYRAWKRCIDIDAIQRAKDIERESGDILTHEELVRLIRGTV